MNLRTPLTLILVIAMAALVSRCADHKPGDFSKDQLRYLNEEAGK